MTSPPCSQPDNYLVPPSDPLGDEMRKRPRIDPASCHKENHATWMNLEQSGCQEVESAAIQRQHKQEQDFGNDSDTDDEKNPAEDDDDSSVEFLYHRPASCEEESTIHNVRSATASDEAKPAPLQQMDSSSTFGLTTGSEDISRDSSTTSDESGRSDFAASDNQALNLKGDMETDIEEATDCEPLLYAAQSTAVTTSSSKITPLTSAYLQNLAEICYTILYDQRWRVGPRSEQLFQWERGDDLSVALALARRFLRSCDNDGNERSSTWKCACLFCKDNESEEVNVVQGFATAPAQPVTQQYTAARQDITEEEDDRCLHLYCRLFYRKGPWFRLDDIYKRYYTTSHRSSTSNTLEEAKINEYLDTLHLLLEDMKRLDEKGFIRGFETEEECGRTVDGTLLSNAERGHVLLRMAFGSKRGRKVPCPPGNSICKQMKTQRPLFPGSRSSCLPVKQHVAAITVLSLAHAVLKASHPKHDPTSSELAQMEVQIKHLLDNVFPSVNRIVTGFCLREEPFRILARCARLYLCATSGPGSMRGDGTNGWRSLLNVPCSEPISGVRIPGIHAWHLADYPGLKARFGLTAYPFHGSFRFMPVVERNDGSLAVERVFETHAEFVALECSVELRAHVDFVVELESMRNYNERRVARGLQPHGNRNASSTDDRSIDFLSLRSPHGRRRIVCSLLKPCQRLDENSILSDIECDIATYGGAFASDCNNILFVVAMIAVHVLCRRNEAIRDDELWRRTSQPWLRHLWWDGNLAYILWDIIPILEKGNHFIAVIALETILFGKTVSTAAFTSIPNIGTVNEFASILLSRRTRGKAFARLFVDYRHLCKRAQFPLKDDPADLEDLKAQQAESINNFFHQSVAQAIVNASIPFSAIRELARPLKQPLIDILGDIISLEAAELGYRLHDASIQNRADRYSEWNPTIDTAVANAITNDENGPGSRCAYIGFEDSDSPTAMNVEELAMEYYRLGRLYDDRGGWQGFHDEGSHVHSLFRIICAGPILGTAWGCGLYSSTNVSQTIHLSPYQGSPFHLLVGHESKSHRSFSFYHSRHARITAVLEKLARLTNQEVADLVYDSVAARRQYMLDRSQSDPTTQDDTSRLRTLSLIAAGLGGKALAAILRCLCFDYRHFRGGMPDLTLVRASTHDDQGNAQTIHLGDWIEESFSVESQNKLKAQRASMILGDEEFLGCSMGDSGGSNSFKRNRSTPRPKDSPESGEDAAATMPERLQLLHNNRPVTVETMLVEVKSANDRLDYRQHDWLNVLDLHCNARVCKFEKNKAKQKSDSK